MNPTKTILLATLVGASIITASYAGPITMTPETWNTAGLQGWTNAVPGVTTLANPGGANGYLLITFLDEGSGPPDPALAHDTIYTFSSPATNSFTGNYIASNVASANFSFSNSVTPASASLVFGVATNAREWSLAFAPISVNGWNTYNIYFNYLLGWSSPGANAADFLADLQAVNWIGIHIDRSGIGQEEYGLDRFQLLIPEPADFLLLAAGILGMALALRRKQLPQSLSPEVPA